MLDGLLPAPVATSDVAVPLTDRIFAWRDRLVASAGFQKWAAAFPLTRFVAQRRAAALFDLCAGFVYSQVLRGCVELNVFEVLREKPLTIDELSGRLAMPHSALERLIGAAISLRLLERRSRNRIGLGALGAPLVGNEGLLALVTHHEMLYDDLRDPIALLRRRAAGDTALARYYPYAAAGAQPGVVNAVPYSALMSATAPPLIDEVLDAYSFAHHRIAMDVGGGEGRFARSLAERWSHLQVRVFDLPAVAALASAATAGSVVADRVSSVPGDFRSDPLPTGADVITLVRVLLDHGDDTALGLLRRARAALAPGGKLLIAEPMSGGRGGSVVGDAYFAMYLFAMGSGRARSEKEITSLCSAAGFTSCRSVRTRYPISTGILIAEF